MENRVIKFRAWHPTQKEMYYLEKASFMGFHGIVDDFVDCDKDSVWMQFIGLYDSKDNEIYESDICQDLLTKMIYVVKFGRCVKYAFNGWYVENEEHGYMTSINGDYDTNKNSQILVIGNIFENPELLKNEN